MLWSAVQSACCRKSSHNQSIMVRIAAAVTLLPFALAAITEVAEISHFEAMGPPGEEKPWGDELMCDPRSEATPATTYLAMKTCIKVAGSIEGGMHPFGAAYKATCTATKVKLTFYLDDECATPAQDPFGEACGDDCILELTEACGGEEFYGPAKFVGCYDMDCKGSKDWKLECEPVEFEDTFDTADEMDWCELTEKEFEEVYDQIEDAGDTEEAKRIVEEFNKCYNNSSNKSSDAQATAVLTVAVATFGVAFVTC